MNISISDLIARHLVDLGHIVHVGAVEGPEIAAYYEAGFYRITVVDADPDRVRSIRTRYPGVEVEQAVCSPAETRGNDEIKVRRLDAIAPSAKIVVINSPGHGRAILATAPWSSIELVIVGTCTTDEPSEYDLMTEAVTTRGYVEVDRWTRNASTQDVAYLKGSRL